MSHPLRGGMGRGMAFWMLLPLVALLVGGFFWPVVAFLATGFLQPAPTLQHYIKIAQTDLYLKVLAETVSMAALVTALTLCLGYPIAVLMARLRGFGAFVVAACVLVPLWTPVLVRTYAWIILLQRRGIVNDTLLAVGIVDRPLALLYTHGAVIVAMTHVMMPFMILPIQASLRATPKDLAQAAVSLGASKLQAFVWVTWPLSLPGVFAGCLMVFIIALGFYITPALLGGPRLLMISTLITQQAFELLNWPVAAALSTVLLVLTMGVAVLFRRMLKIDRMMLHA